MSYTLADLIDEAGWIPAIDLESKPISEALLEQRINEHVNRKASERLYELAEEFSNDHDFPVNQKPTDYLNGFYNGLMKAAKVLAGDD